MATFVLVHGAFQGSWCWRKVIPLLRAAQHDVYAPTLTGLGERVHLLGPDVNLSTHIQDIVNVLFYEDLSEVILVGHSYAGMVIAGVAEAIPESLGHVIYLDVGSVPDDRRSYFDTLSPEIGEQWTSNAIEAQGTRVFPASSTYWPLFLSACSITDPVDIDWMEPRLTPQPLATMEEPARLSTAHAPRVRGSYIRCRPEKNADAVEELYTKVRARGWDYYEIQSDHEVMITAPRALASLLADIAQS
jgi:pimeloyl-ACP methyl ester carboxylesterase